MPLPDFVSPKAQSKRQEKRLAKALGGKLTPGSGNQWHSKGDVKAREVLLEAKSTDNLSIKVSAEVWEKIEKEATRANKIPALALSFSGINGQAINLVAVLEDDFVTRFK